MSGRVKEVGVMRRWPKRGPGWVCSTWKVRRGGVRLHRKPVPTMWSAVYCLGAPGEQGRKYINGRTQGPHDGRRRGFVRAPFSRRGWPPPKRGVNFLKVWTGSLRRVEK